MTDTNQALVIKAPGKMVIEEHEIPKILDDEILVKVRYVAVCGSDVKLYAGTYTGPHHYPLVFGHEWIGQVEKCGKEVSPLSGICPGSYVVGNCSVFCGHCYYCGFNRNHCEAIEKRGISVDGGASRYIAVKAIHAEPCVEMENIKLFTLTEPVSVAVTGIRTRVPKEVLSRTRRALIIGCGGIGIASLLTLFDSGIPDITMIDIAKEKADYVSSLIGGFPQHGPSISVRCIDTAALVKEEKLSGSEGFDLIVEASGAAPSLQAAVYAAAPCAHIVMLGHQKPMEYDFGTVMQKSLTIHASNGSTGGFIDAMKIIQSYPAVVSGMITDEISYREAPEYFKEKIHSPSKIKVLIDMQ